MTVTHSDMIIFIMFSVIFRKFKRNDCRLSCLYAFLECCVARLCSFQCFQRKTKSCSVQETNGHHPIQLERERDRERGGKEREGEGERERIDDPSPNHALIIYDWIRSSNRGMTKA